MLHDRSEWLATVCFGAQPVRPPAAVGISEGRVRHWPLRSLRVKLIKTGGRMVRGTRYLFFQLAEVAVPRKLFARILEGVNRLRLVPA